MMTKEEKKAYMRQKADEADKRTREVQMQRAARVAHAIHSSKTVDNDDLIKELGIDKLLAKREAAQSEGDERGN